MKKDSRYSELEHWVHSISNSNIRKISIASEDASFRRYFRVFYDSGTAIVMDAPPDKENILPFIDVTDKLLNVGVHAPQIIAIDNNQGYLLLEDLGNKDYLDYLTTKNADSLYKDAIKALFLIQEANTNEIPAYDETLLLTEMQLFTSWFLNRHLSLSLSPNEESDLTSMYQSLTCSALEQPKVFTHRDYHSRNLMITKIKNPGVIDFQDAVYGPFTYDLVSLLRDCYISWPDEKIERWKNHYLGQFLKRNPDRQISTTQFSTWFDLMGVQRHLKAIGIFSRLNHRDGKSGYLKDIPRTLAYITQAGSKHGLLDPLLKIIDHHKIEKRIQVDPEYFASN